MESSASAYASALRASSAKACCAHLQRLCRMSLQPQRPCQPSHSLRVVRVECEELTYQFCSVPVVPCRVHLSAVSRQQLPSLAGFACGLYCKLGRVRRCALCLLVAVEPRQPHQRSDKLRIDLRRLPKVVDRLDGIAILCGGLAQRVGVQGIDVCASLLRQRQVILFDRSPPLSPMFDRTDFASLPIAAVSWSLLGAVSSMVTSLSFDWAFKTSTLMVYVPSVSLISP